MQDSSQPKRSRSLRGYLLVALAATLWGTTGTSQALAPAGFTPLTVGALRILVGGLVLLAIAGLRGKFRQRRRWSLRAVLLAGVMVAVYQVAFFEGTLRTGVATGTMVGIGSAPLFAGLLEVAWARQRPSASAQDRLSRTWFLATALALSGIVLLLGARSDVQLDPLGVLFALTAGLSYVIYAAVVRHLTQAHPPEEVVAVVFCLGALLLLPFLLTADLAPALTPGGLVVVLHLGVLATGLSYTFFGYGMREVPVSSAATLTLMEPLTAATLGILLLGEPLGLQRAAGMPLLLGGLIVLAWRPSASRVAAAAPE